jgi:hypothetical protein
MIRIDGARDWLAVVRPGVEAGKPAFRTVKPGSFLVREALVLEDARPILVRRAIPRSRPE